MTDGVFLHWSSQEARIRSFSSGSRRDTTVVKIEIEVVDSYCLGRILRELHEAQAASKVSRRSAPRQSAAQAKRIARAAAAELDGPGPFLFLPAPEGRS
ncbi:MAG TPA: hypothetical protein VFT56_01140 [Sphingomonas sp.]|nr:hypothetical protein [Sphingomonas sp.]